MQMPSPRAVVAALGGHQDDALRRAADVELAPQPRGDDHRDPVPVVAGVVQPAPALLPAVLRLVARRAVPKQLNAHAPISSP